MEKNISEVFQMVIKPSERKITVNEQMRGGNGSVVIEHLLDRDGLYGKGRLYARITLKPGCSIGYHVHEGEMETFYILKGTVTYDDNGTPQELTAGDVAYTADGEGHSVSNNGGTDVEMLALIINN
jgi:quercetin dioxygenase-like cupin family protein